MSSMRPPQGEQNNAALSFKKRRNTNDENSNERGGSYRKFDEDSLHARKVLIESYAALYIAHLDGNSGKCKRGFMQGLVEKASRVACSLEITRSDIYNEVGRVKQKSKAMENSLPTVSPVMFGEASSPRRPGTLPGGGAIPSAPKETHSNAKCGLPPPAPLLFALSIAS